MKNLFTVDVDSNEEYGEYSSFILRKVDAELSQRQNESFEELDEHQKKASLPFWLSIIKFICMLAFMIILVAMVKSLDEVGLDVFTRIPWLTAVGAIGGITALVLHIVERQKQKTVAESDDFKEDIAEAEKIIAESREALGIPSDAVNTDVFLYPCKTKKGKINNANSEFEFMNMELKLFLEDGYLCFADADCVIGIPVCDITEIVSVDGRRSFFGWNKEEAFNKGEYKKYKITQNNFGTNFSKNCYALRLVTDGNEYEIIFPPYELDTFTRMTGKYVSSEE